MEKRQRKWEVKGRGERELQESVVGGVKGMTVVITLSPSFSLQIIITPKCNRLTPFFI